MENLKILALSGSLRKNSLNSAAINALKILAPQHVEIIIGEIGDLPLFNPDRENENIPSLNNLKASLGKSLGKSSGIIVASPEYAHGISGPLKNALDWLVSGVEFPNIPIMLVNTSPRASHALAHLREVLSTMSGIIIDEAYVSIPLLGSSLNCDGILKDKDIASLLQTQLERFCNEIEGKNRLILC